ncbi:MAG: hypothetical protein HYZ46_07325 [Nitrosomonadales bacterium]|nr:hypothetical protein [Nitrosomonadales bacterium]
MLLLSLVHLFALWSIWSSILAVWAQLGVALPVLLSLFYHLHRHALLLGKQSWRTFSLNQKRVLVITQNGEEFSGEVSSWTVVTPYVVLLRLKLAEQRLSVSQVIFPDALQAGAFRELCVRLKLAQ